MFRLNQNVLSLARRAVFLGQIDAVSLAQLLAGQSGAAIGVVGMDQGPCLRL